MEIFSEIYGKYYHIMSHLLKNGTQSLAQMRNTIHELGFGETDLYFEPNITNGDWSLFEKNKSGEFKPIVSGDVKMPPTLLEKAWLRAVLEDQRAKLFLTEDEIALAKEKLGATQPLFKADAIVDFDQFDVGDDYTSYTIQKHFSLFLEAMKSSKAVLVKYLSAKGKNLEGTYIPCKFEYSPKNDKFRVLAIELENEGYRGYTVLNLGRVQSVELTDISAETDYLQYFLDKRNKEDRIIDIEITDERNAMERFMVEFSIYKKEAAYDKERDVLKVKLYYDPLDATEILVKILGFGPVLKVLGPDSFVDMIKERLLKQKSLGQ